ncbi:MAG: T9SS type A sorting domain-containing protein [Aureispira sp.]|nr:T9SS type A sorting domain-containing protein [Aureispira sp.]
MPSPHNSLAIKYLCFLLLTFFLSELSACDKNIIGAVSPPNNLINSGERGCVTGDFSGSVTVNPGGELYICGQFTFVGAINVADGAKVVITSGSSIGVVGSLNFNDFESLEYLGDPSCNAEIYAVTTNSCFVTWGAAPGLAGEFCNSSNVYLDGFNFAWGLGTIGSAISGRAPSLCPSGGSSPCETLLNNILSFDARQVDQHVLLEWSTETDKNIEYFSIERSVDGFNWEVIGTINSNNSSVALNIYNFIDNHPFKLGTYYRVRYTDFEGQLALSTIKFISGLSKDNNFSIFPNPSNGKFNLYLEQDHNFDRYKIIDNLGCVVSQGNLDPSSVQEIDLKRFNTGVYLIVISSQETVFMRRIKVY